MEARITEIESPDMKAKPQMINSPKRVANIRLGRLVEKGESSRLIMIKRIPTCSPDTARI